MLLVDRGGDDELPLDVADDAARQHGRTAERVQGINCEDAVGSGQPENRHLRIAHERPDAHVRQQGIKVADGGPGGAMHGWDAHANRMPFGDVRVPWCHGNPVYVSTLGLSWVLGHFRGDGRSPLAALAHENEGVVPFVAVDECPEALEFLRILDGGLPFALVGADHVCHLGLKVSDQAEAVLDDHGFEVVEAALEVLHPHRCALQAIGCADVEHQKAVNQGDQRRIVETRGEQIRMARPHAAVATDVEIPADLGGDDADVLALRLRALSGAAGHGELELVRRPQALVAVLNGDGHADAVKYAVAAPGATDAGLHGAHRLAVGMAGLEASVDQFAPDKG